MLACYRKNYEIIKKIVGKDFDVNQPIFRVSLLPSYFYLACVLQCDKAIKDGSSKYSWNGLPVCLYRKKYNDVVLTATSLSQYRIMYQLKLIYNAIENKDSENILSEIRYKYNLKFEKGIYLMDYLVMQQDKKISSYPTKVFANF